MNYSFAEKDGKPTLVKPDHVNFGLAIDLVKANGDRQLVVAGIKKAETLNFFEFWQAYEDIVRRARVGKLTMDDFTGVTVSLTNPGGLGTVHSVPRLMPGQSVIMGVGSMDYPAEFQGTSQDTLNKLGISKVMTLTSTYDHRVIQAPPPASSCASSRTCCSARTASTTPSSSRCASRTSPSAGTATSTPATTTTSRRPPASSS